MESPTEELTGRQLLLRLGGLLNGSRHLFAEHLSGLRTANARDWEDDEDDIEMEPGAREDDDDPGVGLPDMLPRPEFCSFLAPGRTFSGTQKLSNPRALGQQEDWAVTATIYSCDFERGRLTGSMVAQNDSPSTKRPIVTYFEGDIIDNVNNTFWTGAKWGTCPTRETDLRHWSRCPGFGPAMRAACLAHDGRVGGLGGAGCRHVFMRWKECFFVDIPLDCPLTISGFYYLSLDRLTGAVRGLYHDARSAPLQVLQLEPVELRQGPAPGTGTGPAAGTGGAAAEAPCGMGFAAYSLC
ncbi:hypothetical protein HYH03_013133 [Edaphochlamys debaryana]|uniref:Uncharacterized protein n=1 Tax=Edaphochlamys debaryana TaxID=47281 RepID=A0A835XQB1_9CHLO|nr:hypothetical protein HYH03_013133 [Edaphochlamys debaryana]|eukprot:KAG2488283.1 hypothetical protein HYH03_013133 [Edaphochlamys debaryana]